MELKFKENLDFSRVQVLGVSGGVDSMVLLALFLPQYPIENLIVAHFDHRIRQDSVSDLYFVEDFCKKYGVKFESGSAKIKSMKGNLEANARRWRYDFLEKVRVKYDAQYIVVAHHANDQAETVLMNFIKGTFCRGLAGMKILDEERKLFRPLLAIPKAELIKYASKNKISYREDSTNVDSTFDRNFLRLDVIPRIEGRFKGFGQRLADSTEYYSDLDEYLSENVDDWIAKYRDRFPRSAFLALPRFFRFLVIEKLTGFSLSRPDYLQVEKLILTAKPRSKRDVGKIRISIHKDGFSVCKF